jgi:hypothetical protein
MIGGVFHFVVRDAAGRVKREGRVRNTITREGFAALANALAFLNGVGVNNGSYFAKSFGVVDDSGFTGVADTDTMALHPGWTEFTSYEYATDPDERPPVVSTVDDLAAGAVQVFSGQFDFTAAGTIRGFFLAQFDDKTSPADGFMWSVSALEDAVVIPVIGGDNATVDYTFTGLV